VGKVELRYEFEKTGEPDFKNGKGAAGKAQLYINKKLVGELALPYTVPLLLGLGTGIVIGRNAVRLYRSSIARPSSSPARSIRSRWIFPGSSFPTPRRKARARKAAMARQ